MLLAAGSDTATCDLLDTKRFCVSNRAGYPPIDGSVFLLFVRSIY